MNKYILIILAVMLLFSCSTIEPVQEPVIEENILDSYLFDEEVRINQNLNYELDENGKLLRGILAEDFILENTKAKFVIPEGIEVEFDDDAKSYVFLLEEEIVTVISKHVSYGVHGYLMFNENNIFAGRVAKDTYFEKNGQDIIFLVNDLPVWTDDEDFNYDYYSKKYRDEIEYDILKDHKIIGIDDLGMQFAAHDGYGVQVYRGESFLVYIETADVELEMTEIENEQDIIKSFNSMNVGRPYITSYKNKLIISLKVPQPDDTEKDGLLEMITTNDEYENLKDIIYNKRGLYLLFRMGMFDDFSTSGYGILYFSYDQSQYDAILSTFDH